MARCNDRIETGDAHCTTIRDGDSVNRGSRLATQATGECRTGRRGNSRFARRNLLGDDLAADVDTLVTDVDERPNHEDAYRALVAATERARRLVLVSNHRIFFASNAIFSIASQIFEALDTHVRLIPASVFERHLDVSLAESLQAVENLELFALRI